MSQQIFCNGCRRRLKVPESVIGKKVKCPSCGASFVATPDDDAPAPKPTASQESAVPIPEKTKVIQCTHCNSALNLPVAFIGKKVKCPKCGQSFRAGEEATSAPPAPDLDEGIQAGKSPPPVPAKSEPKADKPAWDTRGDPDEDEDRPSKSKSKRGRDDDEDDDDDRRGRRRRGRGRDGDEDDDDDDDDRRGRRRRRSGSGRDYDDDDSDDNIRRPRQLGRPRSNVDASGVLTPPAVFLMITGILGILINGFQCIGAIAAPQMFQQQGNPFGGGQAPPVELQAILGAVFSLVSLATIGGSVAMMKKQFYGIAMTGAILAMLNIGNCCCLLGLPAGIWALTVLARSDVKDAFS